MCLLEADRRSGGKKIPNGTDTHAKTQALRSNVQRDQLDDIDSVDQDACQRPHRVPSKWSIKTLNSLAGMEQNPGVVLRVNFKNRPTINNAQNT